MTQLNPHLLKGQAGQNAQPDPLSLASLIGHGAMDEQVAALLAACVHARKNMLICGGMLTGKTTLLRALAAVVPPYERLVSVERSPELGLDQDQVAHPRAVALCGGEPVSVSKDEGSLAERVRQAQQLGFDRLIVGDLRGAEVVPVLEAMGRGGEGIMAAVRASTLRGAFAMLAADVLHSAEHLPPGEVNQWIASSVQVVVRLGWDLNGGRCVAEICEVTGAGEDQVQAGAVYGPGPSGRAVFVAPLRRSTQDDLAAVGYRPAEAGS